MPKKQGKHSNEPKQMVEANTLDGPITCTKDGNIILKILAKPGAKMNCITDINDDGISVQINAAPVEGEANTELIKYISKIIGMKKGDIRIQRGGKSRHKTLVLSAVTTSIQEILEKLNISLQENKNNK